MNNHIKKLTSKICASREVLDFFVLAIIIILVLNLLLVTSCTKTNKKNEAKRLVAAWIGKEMHFPESVTCSLQGLDTMSNLCESLYQADFKVLLYVDSTGCSDCRLKLFLWEDLMQESDSLFLGRLSFLFFIQPKKSAPREVNELLRRNHFDHPVFLDVDDQLNKQNQLPRNPVYQCFLLDKFDRVLLIGNPVLNPQIWLLFKKAIIEDAKVQPAMSLKSLTMDRIVNDVGKINQLGSCKAIFALENKGDKQLFLYEVLASCGCDE